MSASASSENPSDTPSASRGRENIYYWKCDRPAAFHGVESDAVRREAHGAETRAALEHILRALGYRHLALESDMSILRARYQQLLRLRETPGGRP